MPDPIAPLALLPTLASELQNLIFSFCNMSSLAVLCRLNKYWYARTMPLLWGEIDFVRECNSDDPTEYSRHFFAVCDALMDEKPERWAILAASVRKLNLGRLHGINMVRDGEWDGSDDYIFFDSWAPVDRRNVLDVVAQFTNLDTLSVYVKNWWGYTQLAASGKALAQSLTNLKSLKTGGQMSTDVLLGLLARPENLQHLSLINLMHTPGQDNGPDSIVFLSDIYDRFTSLKSLHLCKLADLDGKLSDNDNDEEDSEDEGERKYDSCMRWKFPRESEVSLLKEWAALLRHCSSTLEVLTLENRYLCGRRYNDEGLGINPGVTHPAKYGAFSIGQSRKILFPVLSGEWPKLRQLTLIGMGEVEDVKQALRHLRPQVEIEQRLAGIEMIGGDVTPEQISTPREFYD